ncbi:hypothetical protein AB0O28_37260 [Microbispora sp. NPDC088329]|uniref:hypothetical protein n=1 Tax=Microbispora sp. NPDC088329 TaxID=3154869 RepID=UPI00342422AF
MSSELRAAFGVPSGGWVGSPECFPATTCFAPTCNVVAGFHHDHLFVPYERTGEAVAVLEDLARRSA